MLLQSQKFTFTPTKVKTLSNNHKIVINAMFGRQTRAVSTQALITLQLLQPFMSHQLPDGTIHIDAIWIR